MPPYIFPQGTFSTYKRGNLTRGILATKSGFIVSITKSALSCFKHYKVKVVVGFQLTKVPQRIPVMQRIQR